MDDYFAHESSYIDEDVKIGKGTKIWHYSHILSNTIIGENCSIGQNVVIGPNVRIGSNCKIQNNVSIYDGVELDDDVFCGPSCVFTNVINPRAHVVRRDEFLITKVSLGATIGANATIVCGNSLGKYSMVGAGAVVTKDVQEYSLVIGNPAVHYKWVSRNGFLLNDDLICDLTGEQYQLSDGMLELVE